MLRYWNYMSLSDAFVHLLISLYKYTINVQLHLRTTNVSFYSSLIVKNDKANTYVFNSNPKSTDNAMNNFIIFK